MRRFIYERSDTNIRDWSLAYSFIGTYIHIFHIWKNMILTTKKLHLLFWQNFPLILGYFEKHFYGAIFCSAAVFFWSPPAAGDQLLGSGMIYVIFIHKYMQKDLRTKQRVREVGSVIERIWDAGDRVRLYIVMYASKNTSTQYITLYIFNLA